MKKIISLSLVLALMLSCCALLTSCAGVTIEDLEKNPGETISTASGNTLSEFFGDEVGLFRVFNSVKDKSAFSIYFENDDNLLGEISRIDATVYSDAKNGKGVLDLAVKYNKDELRGTLYSDKSGFTLESEDIFGDTAYAFNFESFIKDFADSDIAKLYGLADDDELDELIDSIKELKAQLAMSAEESAEKANELINGLLATLEPTVVTESIEQGDKKVDVLSTKYEISNDTIDAMLSYIYKAALKDYDESGDLKKTLDEITEELDADIDLTFAISIDAKSNKLVQISLTGEIEPKYGEDSAVDFAIDFCSNKISIVGEIEVDKETTRVDFSIEKKIDGKNVSYILLATVEMGAATVKVLDGSVNFTDKGKFSIEADVISSGSTGATTELEVKGKYEVKDKSASLTFESFKFGDASIRFDLGIKIDADPKIPTAPSKAKDIVTLTSEDIEKLGEDIANSELGKLIGLGGEPAPDLEFVEAYDTVYTLTEVELRYTPSDDSADNIFTTASAYTPLTRTAYNDEWSRVIYQGNVCYVENDYIISSVYAE